MDLFSVTHPTMDFWPQFMDPYLLMDQGFGQGLVPDADQPALSAFARKLARMRWFAGGGGGGEKDVPREVVSDTEKFQVTLNLSSFKTTEICVKVLDNTLDVSAEHEEKADEFGHISRRFHRRYFLPRSALVEHMTCTFNDAGVLVVTAPKKPSPETKGVGRKIPIKLLSNVKTVALQAEPQQSGGGVEVPVKHEAVPLPYRPLEGGL